MSTGNRVPHNILSGLSTRRSMQGMLSDTLKLKRNKRTQLRVTNPVSPLNACSPCWEKKKSHLIHIDDERICQDSQLLICKFFLWLTSASLLSQSMPSHLVPDRRQTDRRVLSLAIAATSLTRCTAFGHTITGCSLLPLDGHTSPLLPHSCLPSITKP